MVGRQPCGGRGGRRLPPQSPTCWSSRLRRSTGGEPFESTEGRHRRTERKGSALPLERARRDGPQCTRQPRDPPQDSPSVLLADLYRAGDAVDESFTAEMIVSADDIAPDVDGTQNVWIRGVGCASAVATFSS